MPSWCTGNIPTELGLCTGMSELWLRNNELTGKHFFAQMDRLVYEYTTDGFVPENALAGRIPTEIGQLAQMQWLALNGNQLTGACLQIIFLIDGKRVYQHLKKTFLLRRQHSDGIRPLHSHAGALAAKQPIDR